MKIFVSNEFNLLMCSRPINQVSWYYVYIKLLLCIPENIFLLLKKFNFNHYNMFPLSSGPVGSVLYVLLVLLVLDYANIYKLCTFLLWFNNILLLSTIYVHFQIQDLQWWKKRLIGLQSRNFFKLATGKPSS